MGGQTEWPDMLYNPSFNQYQKAPSEVSDVSSAAAVSPYMSQLEPYDTSDNNNNPSPLLAPENSDSGIYDGPLVGMDSFTISDRLNSSPYISPQLVAQQDPADMGPTAVPFLSTTSTAAAPLSNAAEYPPSAPTDDTKYVDAGGGLVDTSQDIGQASQMAPPSINVELAPPSRASTFGPAKPLADMDSLSPPVSNQRESQSPIIQRRMPRLIKNVRRRSCA